MSLPLDLITLLAPALSGSFISNIPNSLTYWDEVESTYEFNYFGFGESDKEDYGLEGAVNCQLEVRLGHHRDRPVKLEERSPGLLLVVTILGCYITQLPDSVILKKWIDDLIISAQQAFDNAKCPVISWVNLYLLGHLLLCKIPALATMMGPLNPMLASGNSAESVIEGPGTGLLSEESQAVIGQVLAQKQVQKLNSKALTIFEDPAYTDIPEVKDTCKGGVMRSVC